MSECDRCFEAAWFAEHDKTPDAPKEEIDQRADEARQMGLYSCSDHR